MDPQAELLDYHSGHQRYWGTNPLTIAIALFSAILARGPLFELGKGWIWWFSFFFIVMNGISALLRMAWYGALANYVLKDMIESKGTLSGLQKTAVECQKAKSYGKFLYLHSSVTGWAIFTIGITFLLYFLLLRF